MGDSVKTEKTWRSVICLFLAGVVLGLAAAPAGADVVSEPPAVEPAPQEVAAFASTFGVSRPQATESIDLQSQEARLPEELEAILKEDFAGVWFDPSAGEFVVPVVSTGGEKTVEEDLQTPQDAYRTESVDSSWSELEEAQSGLMAKLAALLPGQDAASSLDAESNSLVVRVPATLDGSEMAAVRQFGAEAHVDTTVEAVEPSSLQVSDLAGECNEGHECLAPLRGGTWWGYPLGDGEGSGEVPDHCTVGFPVVGNQEGNRFMLTAGHCVAALGEYEASYKAAWENLPLPERREAKEIGPLAAFRSPLDHSTSDWALFKANGSYFDPGTATPRIAAWGTGENYEILSEGSSYMGQMMCHSGAETGASCGPVTGTDETFNSQDYESEAPHKVEHVTEFGPVCAQHGDSGGPVYSGHTAFGIFTSGAELQKAGCNQVGFYREITQVDEEAGVHVGPKVGTKPVVQIGYEEPATLNNGRALVELHGSVDANGISTNYHFDYGTTTAYGQSSLGGNVGTGFQPVLVTQNLEGLPGKTTYHYRLTGQSTAGTVMTQLDHTFTTPAWPAAATMPAASIGSSQATLDGSLNPDGLPTTYHFEYGPTTAYGTSTSSVNGGSGATEIGAAAAVTGLLPAMAYHYRLVAQNSAGTRYGPDGTFETLPEAPRLVTAPAEEIGSSKATLTGSVNPHGSPTTYYFAWGTSYNSLRFRTPETSAGAGRASIPVRQGIIGLEPGHEYFFQLVATNAGGTTSGSIGHLVTLKK